ncbi:hypothetical protein [Aquimarina rubra]|uniref:Beta-lactamase-inhibitor-like PepSY-like domain-containing protein n=1 Tax=Aquimarina rubra TaxID=1920033 RepID=A0ABW5LFN0_9FLAO
MIKNTLVVLLIVSLISCGGRISNQPANETGFKAIENELKTQFGDNAYYTNVSITYNKSIGNTVIVIVTKDPESLKMGQWNLVQDSWGQNSDVTITIPDGTRATDFMFQLNDKINLAKLGELVEQSVEKLKTEKDLDNPTLSIANIKFPKNGDVSKTEYTINLTPENGGTTFMFYYTLDGKLIKKNY